MPKGVPKVGRRFYKDRNPGWFKKFIIAPRPNNPRPPSAKGTTLPITEDRRAYIKQQIDEHWQHSPLDVADMLRDLLDAETFWRQIVNRMGIVQRNEGHVTTSMTLLEAIMLSRYGIATRRVFFKHDAQNKPIYVHEIAVATQRHRVFIFTGRTGGIRRVGPADNSATDWVPFQYLAASGKLKIAKKDKEAAAGVIEPSPIDVDDEELEKKRINSRARAKDRMARAKKQRAKINRIEAFRQLRVARKKLAGLQREEYEAHLDAEAVDRLAWEGPLTEVVTKQTYRIDLEVRLAGMRARMGRAVSARRAAPKDYVDPLDRTNWERT